MFQNRPLIQFGRRKVVEIANSDHKPCLVTKGTCELEVFIEPDGLNPNGYVVQREDGPIGEYVGEAVPCDNPPAKPDGSKDVEITLNAQVDMDFASGAIILHGATAFLRPEDIARIQADPSAIMRLRIPFVRAYSLREGARSTPGAAMVTPSPAKPVPPALAEAKTTEEYLMALNLDLQMQEEADPETVDGAYLAMSASGIKGGMFSKPAPYYIIHQVDQATGKRTAVFQSNVVKGSDEPVFAPAKLYLPSVCGGDPEQSLVITMHNFNKDGKDNNHQLLGETAILNLYNLLDAAEAKSTIPLMSGTKPAGVLSVSEARLFSCPPMMSYVNAGLRFKTMMAVDFTSGNAEGNLHSLGNGSSVITNPYASTLAVLATVMQRLNGGRPFPAYGFGASVPGTNKKGKAEVGLFPLTNPSNVTADATVDSPAQLITAYRAAVGQVTPEPARPFSAILGKLVEQVTAEGPLSKDNKHYTMLTILTCGTMSDAKETLSKLLSITQLPASVLVIGIAPSQDAINVRFTEIMRLDTDIAGMHLKDAMSMRDNVSFASMPADADPLEGATALAGSALSSVCDHLVQYMQMMDI